MNPLPYQLIAAIALAGIVFAIAFLLALFIRTYQLYRQGQLKPPADYFGNWDKPHDWPD